VTFREAVALLLGDNKLESLAAANQLAQMGEPGWMALVSAIENAALSSHVRLFAAHSLPHAAARDVLTRAASALLQATPPELVCSGIELCVRAGLFECTPLVERRFDDAREFWDLDALYRVSSVARAALVALHSEQVAPDWSAPAEKPA